MADHTRQRMESALRESSPSSALVALARELKAEDTTQREMYQLFDEYRAEHESEANESRYNAILDTMDVIAGWCKPDSRLFDTELLT
jgi:hypothetical protein